MAMVWSGSVLAQTISIADYAATHVPVAQRVAGTNSASLTFNGTYTGAAPATIDIQIVDYDTHGTVVKAWTTCPSPTISGGNWSGCTIGSVPTHTNWTAAEARENGATPVSGFTTTKFGVGSVFLFGGDSYQEFFWTYRVGSPTANQLVACSGLIVCNNSSSAYRLINSGIEGNGILKLADIIQPAFNWPMLFLAYIKEDSCIVESISCSLKWLVSGVLQTIPSDLTSRGITDLEAVVWKNAGADARGNASTSAYTTAMTTLYADLLATTPRTAAQLPIFHLQPGANTGCSPEITFAGPCDIGFNNVRGVIQGCATVTMSGGTPCRMSSSMVDGVLVDQWHYDATSNLHQGYRDGQSILYYYGLSGATYDGVGPSVNTASYVNTVVTVNLTMNGSASITDAAADSCATVLTGWSVSYNGIAATITNTSCSGSNVYLTTSAAATAPVTVTYYNGLNPTRTNLTYGNALPGADTLGIPLLPTNGAVTATPSSQLNNGLMRRRF